MKGALWIPKNSFNFVYCLFKVVIAIAIKKKYHILVSKILPLLLILTIGESCYISDTVLAVKCRY